MRNLTTLLLLTTFSSFGQTTIEVDKERLEIDSLIIKDPDKLIVLVKVLGENDLKKVIDENWPEDIETTYNILKNAAGQIIFIAEIPTSESGDWYLEIRHYFTTEGNLLAYAKNLSYFNDNCGDGIVRKKEVELYDNQFTIIQETKSLLDQNGKYVDEKECDEVFNWNFDKRPTLKELVDLKKIRE